MITRTWTRAAIAGLLVGTLSACAHEEKKQPQAAAPSTPVARAQAASQQAAQQAAQADKDLTAARQRLEAAHQESMKSDQAQAQAQAQARQAVAAAEQRAVQAQQRVALERSNVQRLDVEARLRHEQAARAAEQAIAASEQAQGLQTASGRVAEASPGRVVLEVDGGRRMSFDLDQRTRVLVGAEQRSVAELQQGAEARVAYDARGNVPAAVNIHVTPARNRAMEGTQPQTPQQR